MNQSLRSGGKSLQQVVAQNQKDLGITQEGMKNLDFEMGSNYNYSHKGLPVEKISQVEERVPMMHEMSGSD